MQFLTVTETAARLGVKRETVYAYVSRGLLTSVRSAERRGSRFAQDEVERLAARGRESGEPSGSVERIRTSLSLLSDDGLYFRGVPAVSLSSLEEVAGLLWQVAPPSMRADPGRAAVARAALEALPSAARLTDRFRVAVAAQAAADPLRADVSEPATTATASSLLGTTLEALGAAPGPAVPAPGPVVPVSGPGEGRDAGTAGDGASPIAERLWTVIGARRGPVPPVFSTALVLLADHGLAASTVAARVAASTRADVYAVVSAGLGALDGRDHGLVSSQAHRFLAEAGPDPVHALAERLRAGERVPGFGHRVYSGPDPRATALFTLLRDDPAAGRVMSTVDALSEGVARGGPLFANVDLALAALMHAHDLRPDAGELMFAVARTVGWVAHALEEYREPGLRFRPTGVYVGPRPD